VKVLAIITRHTAAKKRKTFPARGGRERQPEKTREGNGSTFTECSIREDPKKNQVALLPQNCQPAADTRDSSGGKPKGGDDQTQKNNNNEGKNVV